MKTKKNRLLVIIVAIIILFALVISFIIPVRTEEEWVNDDAIAEVGHYATIYYNLYGIKIKEK